MKVCDSLSLQKGAILGRSAEHSAEPPHRKWGMHGRSAERSAELPHLYPPPKDAPLSILNLRDRRE